MVVAATVVVATVLYVLMQVLGGEKKKKLPVTLQDPTVKYPLCLVDKQVEQRMNVYLTFFFFNPSHTHAYDTFQTTWVFVLVWLKIDKSSHKQVYSHSCFLMICKDSTLTEETTVSFFLSSHF